MSSYKTSCCRYFDERGEALKPYCSQGSRCRFIHPSDSQWDKAAVAKRQKLFADLEKAKDNIKDKPSMSPTSPSLEPRSSPLMSQSDLFKRNHDGNDQNSRSFSRDRRGRDSGVRDRGDRTYRDKSRDGYLDRRGPRERRGEYKVNPSTKSLGKKRDQGDHRGSSFAGDKSHREIEGPSEVNQLQVKREANPASLSINSNAKGLYAPDIMRATDVASVNTGDYFHRLASLSSQLIQNSCACTKEEDKLKAFTDLSSQLSQTAPAAAKAMAPTLLAVVVSHSQHKERVERVIQEIDSLWGELFSVFANGIATALDVKLQNSLEALRQEKDLVRSGVHAQSISLKRKAKDTETDPSLNEGLKQSAIEDSAHKETDNMSVHTEQRYPDSSENKRRRLVMGSNRTVEQPPLVPDAGIQEILASLMSQMAKQTQALEMLAQENHQLQYEQADSADNRPSSRRSESFDDFAGSYSSNPVNP